MNLNSSFSLVKWMLAVQGLYSVHPTLILRSAAFSWTEEMCVNPNGVTVGPKGRLLHIETNKTIAGTTFERKRGDSCPCSYAETKCEINDPKYGTNKDCSKLLIDGRDAALNGYPDVQVKHTLRVCNYNQNDIIELSKPPMAAKVEFFYPVSETGTKNLIVDESYSGHLLKPGECRSEIATTSVSTRRAKYFMEAILQGTRKTPSGGTIIDDGFCFAHSFNKIDFKYDYGFGECKMNTETSCYRVDEMGQRLNSCEDFINSLDHKCTRFQAMFIAHACNDNDRDIDIQVSSSSYMISTYNLKSDGNFERQKTSLQETLRARECQEFITRKTIDPCKRNFWQVNVQGKHFIEDDANGWFFKDKDCESFAFSELPVVVDVKKNRDNEDSINVFDDTSYYRSLLMRWKRIRYRKQNDGKPAKESGVIVSKGGMTGISRGSWRGSAFRESSKGSTSTTESSRGAWRRSWTRPTTYIQRGSKRRFYRGPAAAKGAWAKGSSVAKGAAKGSNIPFAAPSKSPSVPTTTQREDEPSMDPSMSPSNSPSEGPTISPSRSPSIVPSGRPSKNPSHKPSVIPSAHPTTAIPTMSSMPSTKFKPSHVPSDSAKPSSSPTKLPSSGPSNDPSTMPTKMPLSSPSNDPSTMPSTSPTADPTYSPMPSHKNKPSEKPSTSDMPSILPSESPSAKPSVGPTVTPSAKPSTNPSKIPSDSPSSRPTKSPSKNPIVNPVTIANSTIPTVAPSPTCNKSDMLIKGDGKAKGRDSINALSPSSCGKSRIPSGGKAKGKIVTPALSSPPSCISQNDRANGKANGKGQSITAVTPGCNEIITPSKGNGKAKGSKKERSPAPSPLKCNDMIIPSEGNGKAKGGKQNNIGTGLPIKCNDLLMPSGSNGKAKGGYKKSATSSPACNEIRAAPGKSGGKSKTGSISKIPTTRSPKMIKARSKSAGVSRKCGSADDLPAVENLTISEEAEEVADNATETDGNDSVGIAIGSSFAILVSVLLGTAAFNYKKKYTERDASDDELFSEDPRCIIIEPNIGNHEENGTMLTDVHRCTSQLCGSCYQYNNFKFVPTHEKGRYASKGEEIEVVSSKHS